METAESGPEVSVVVPTLDARATIDRALSSVVQDGDIQVEVLVVDDGSSDSTRDLVRRREDDRVRLLSTVSPRSGPSSARNVGMEAAQGRWVAFLDADDWWAPGRLKALLETASTHDADLVADDVQTVPNPCSGDILDPTLFSRRKLAVRTTCPLTLRLLIEHDLGWLMPVVRRDLLEDHAIRFSACGRATEDFAFLFHCVSAARRAVLMEKAMYYYRKTPGALTVSSSSPSFWLDSLRVTAELLAGDAASHADVGRLLEQRIRRSWNRYAYLAARIDVASGRPLRALARLLRSPGAGSLAFTSLLRRLPPSQSVPA